MHTTSITCSPGTAPRAPSRRCSTCDATVAPPNTTNSSTRQVMCARPGRSSPNVWGSGGRGGLDRLRSIVRGLVDNDGITYIQARHGDAISNGDGTAEPGPWHLDALPMVLSASDWDALESG